MLVSAVLVFIFLETNNHGSGLSLSRAGNILSSANLTDEDDDSEKCATRLEELKKIFEIKKSELKQKREERKKNCENEIVLLKRKLETIQIKLDGKASLKE